MVRKRTRTSRKYYESEDNDSDSDYGLEDPSAQPAPKKYSLRQRKKAVFIDDYDYEDDDEILPIPPTKAPSDDEDFQVENEFDNSHYSTYDEQYEDPTEDPNGLIDFEDMIRADIVVNKNRIDYDNMINKTEIKMQPSGGLKPSAPVKSKRGRKPKKRPDNEIHDNLKPETAVQGSCHDKVSNIEEDNVTATNFASEVAEQQNTDDKTDDAVEDKHENEEESHSSHSENAQETIASPEDEPLHDPDSTNHHLNSQESVIKFNESYVHKSTHLNGSLSSTDTPELSEIKEELDDDDDDDVVFIEDNRSEIIVLDD